jgi:hypothetical protein
MKQIVELGWRQAIGTALVWPYHIYNSGASDETEINFTIVVFNS